MRSSPVTINIQEDSNVKIFSPGCSDQYDNATESLDLVGAHWVRVGLRARACSDVELTQHISF